MRLICFFPFLSSLIFVQCILKQIETRTKQSFISCRDILPLSNSVGCISCLWLILGETYFDQNRGGLIGYWATDEMQWNRSVSKSMKGWLLWKSREVAGKLSLVTSNKWLGASRNKIAQACWSDWVQSGKILVTRNITHRNSQRIRHILPVNHSKDWRSLRRWPISHFNENGTTHDKLYPLGNSHQLTREDAPMNVKIKMLTCDWVNAKSKLNKVRWQTKMLRAQR